MEPQLPENQLSDSPFTKKNLIKYSPLIAVVLVILTALYLFQLGYISFPGFRPTTNDQRLTTTSPTKSLTQKLELCDVKVGENPLVVEMSQSGDTITGALAGNLNQLILNKAESATIHLDSFRTEESFDFTVPNDPGMLSDQTKSPPTKASIADLKQGQVLKVQFNCFPKQPDGKKFRLARVDIIQKR